MQLDFRSVVFTCGLVTFFVSLLLWVYALTLRQRRPEILAWGLAYCFLLVGSVFIILRNQIPDFLSIVLGNALILSYGSALLVGISFFRGKKPPWGLAIAVPAALFLWVGYFTYARASFPARFYGYNSCMALVFFWSVGALARKPEPWLAAMSRIAASMLAVMGLVALARIGLALYLGLPEKLMGASTWDSLMQVIQTMAVCTLAFSLILLRAERLNSELARAVGDRELLVREMAHRTKNDLTLVDSLISLEENAIGSACGDSAEDTAARVTERFGALRERVRCMARAHERLSLSKELGSVRLDEYLKAVAEGLPSRPGVLVQCDFAAAEVPFSLASPLGLVMNELAINALKYAFPEGREGRLSLALRVEVEEGGRRLRLEVADDGVGMSWPPKKPGLGFVIVESFAKQLDGKLDYSSAGGSSFSLSLAAGPSAAR